MAQVFYQNLPIPSSTDSLPLYVNNELIIIGDKIAQLDSKIDSSGSGSNQTDLLAELSQIQTEINTIDSKLLNQTSDISNLNDYITIINSKIVALSGSTDTNTNLIITQMRDIEVISSDNIISQSEKSQIFRDYKQIYNEYAITVTKSSLYNLNIDTYIRAYNALWLYLTNDPISIPPNPLTNNGVGWCEDPRAINIDGVLFRQLFTEYYAEKQRVDKNISNQVKTDLEVTTILAAGAADVATQAASDAATAISMISAVSDDNHISQNEKNRVFVEWKAIYDEKPGIVTQATNASVSSTAYVNAYNTLVTYLTTAPISIENPPTTGAAWCADPTSIVISGITFRTNFITYYNERQNLLNGISTALKTIADTASTNATAAQTAATTASANATTALNGINDILNDGKITQDEKPTIFMDWKAIYDEKPDIVTKATSYSVSTTNYTTAYTTLANYLTAAPISIDATPTTGVTWCASNTAITITATTFRGNFTSYYNERQLLLNAVAAAAKVLADNAQSTANTANATANTANTNASNAVATANSAATTASGAATAAADRLSKSTNNVLAGSGAIIAGSLVINSSGARTSGSGVAMTSTGLAGFNSAGSSTFAIDTSGNATFAGALSAASGSFAGSLSAVTGSFAAVAINSSGSLSAGKTSQASTTSGFWLGGDGQFNFGTTSNSLIYNGTTLVFTGQLNVGGTNYATSDFLNSNTTATQVGLGNVSNLTPANQTSTGLNAGTTITGGGITMSAGGVIKGGKTGFADTTNAGFVIGYGTGASLNQYGFKFGNGTMTNGISWDGTSLNMNGGTVVIGSSPSISGTTMTGTGARFEAGGNWCAGNGTTNISFNGTQMTLNGNVVANGNIMTDAVSTVKVSANSITNLLTSYWNTSLNPTPSPYTTWNLFHSYSFTVPTVGDSTTTLVGLFQVIVNSWNKNTTAGNVSRIQIGIGLSNNSTPTTSVRGSSSSMYMVAADGVDPIADYYGADYPATTDSYVSEVWTSSLTQGASYTVRLFYYISSTSGPRAVLDHASINVTFLKR